MGAVGLGRAATGGMVRQNLEGIHDLLEGRRGNGVVAAHGNRGGKTQRRLAFSSRREPGSEHRDDTHSTLHGY